nr:hypothetical protein [Tanacetum cinerariifolium]
MVEKSKLDKDKERKAIDPPHYHGMIGTLLYLTASRPDLQFVICMCAPYQDRPTKKHLHAVKRIFRCLRGTVNRDTRRSTSGSLQLLEDRLISWSSKRQKSAALSSTEAEYIALLKHIDIIYYFIMEYVENGVIELYFVNTKYQLADLFTKALGRERIKFLINKMGMRSFTPETLKQLTDEVDEYTLGLSTSISDIISLKSRAFLVTANVPKIYMQEFWATATVHQHFIRFKMDTRKYIVDLESFREMLHISPRVPGQSFAELPFEEEILEFLRHETHISQQGGSSTDEGTGEKTDESDDEAEKVNDDDDDEEEISKIGEQEATESDEGNDEATKSDGENSKDDDNNKEDQGLRIGEEERMQEEEEADELYRDVDINQGRGLQVSQDIEDSHVTLTLTRSDGQQESSSTSLFMTNMLNPIIDPGMESTFTTGSSTVTPIPSPQSTMTPSIISTFTTASQLPTPSTQIPSLDLQSLPTFASVFRFEDSVKLLEVNFSNISGIVNQYMHQQIPEAIREAVQTQTDRLQDSIQRENDEFLKTIDENMKKIIKEQVKTQVKAQVTRILPRIEESANAQLEAEVPTRSSHSSRISYAVAADLLEIKLKKILIDKMEGNKREDDDQEGPSAGSDRGSKRQREGGDHASASTPSKPATGSAGRLPVRWRNPHIRCLKQIEDLVPRAMWIQEPMNYDKYALWGVSHWGRKRQQFYGFAVNQESALNVYSKMRIIAVTELKILEWHNYKHLDWISVRRDDDKIYKFKEGDFKRLCLQDIEDMLLLLVQGKLSNLTVEERFAFNVSLKMFTRSIVIQWRMKDLQLGVEGY